MLLHPIHPVHWDLAYFAGWKVVMIVLWLPIAVVLSLLFRPEFHIEPIDAAVFAVAIWGAYFVRALMYSNLGHGGLLDDARLGPIIQVVMTFELLFSGRLVPLSLMPDWAQRLADVLPFKWTFGYPIEALIGQLPVSELLGGLAMQALWIVIARDRHPADLAVRRAPLRRGGRLTWRVPWSGRARRRRLVREPLRPFKLFGTFFRVGALNELQYRANLAVQVFQSIISLADRARGAGTRVRPDDRTSAAGRRRSCSR